LPGNNSFAWQIQNGACISSDYVAINVYSTVNITSQPADITVSEGSIASFSIETEGTPDSIQWFKNDTLLVDDNVHYYGTNSSTLIIANVKMSDAGDYHCVIASQGCNNVESNSATLTVEEANNNSEVNLTDFVIYPNPVTDHLYIKSPLYMADIQIFNVTGEKVFSQSSIDKNFDIDFSNFSKGLYFIFIQINDASYNFKVIKQ